MKRNRVDVVLDRLEQTSLGQLVMTDATSIFYLIDIWVGAGERLVALYLGRHWGCCFFVNNMFSLPPDPGVKVVRFSDTDPYLEMLAGCADDVRPLGVDKNMPAHFLLPLTLIGCGVEYVDVSICVDGAGAVKGEEETEVMRCVSAINDKAMAEFKALLKEGITEREISNQMKGIYQKLGADNLSFLPSMCFGTNAVIGHYRPRNIALKKGGCALLDAGCKKDSYCAGIIRTFFYGKIAKKEHRRVYELVLGASRTAGAIIKPGAGLYGIDAAARKVTKDTGYGDRFIYRLGYLIGLEVYDFGDVSGINQGTAVPGNTFSIEPGIYLEGDVRVRIEGLALVTEMGYEILDSHGKDLETI